MDSNTEISPQEANQSPENKPERNNRSDVLRSFNLAFAALEQIPSDQLSTREEWIKASVENAKRLTIDQGKATFINEFDNLETGEHYNQEEGVPIEGLLEVLGKKIDSLSADDPQRQTLINAGHILYRNSLRFSQNPDRMEPARLLGRVRQEAYFISRDHRATGDPVSDYFKGNNALMGRIELVIPEEQSNNQPAQPEPTQSPEPDNITPEPPPGEVSTPVEIKPAASTQPPSQGEEPATQQPAEEQPQVREGVIGSRQEDIWKRSRMEANRLIEKEMQRGRGLNPLNWPRKIGLHILKEYWRQRLTKEAMQSAIENNNAYSKMDLARSTLSFVDLFRRKTKNINYQPLNQTQTAEQTAGQAKVKEIKSLLYEKGITDTGERVTGARSDIIEVSGQLKQTIIDSILRPIIEKQDSPLINARINNISDLQAALRAFVDQHQDDADVKALFGTPSQYGQRTEYFATDLMELAEAIRSDVYEHNRYALNQIAKHTRLLMASARWAGETQAHFNRVDRLVQRIESRRGSGILINAATIGAVSSLAAFGITRIPALMQYAGVIIPGAGIIGGSAAAGIRTAQHEKEAVAMHRQEKAYNLKRPPNAPRRESLDELLFDTASATDLSNTLRASLNLPLKEDPTQGIDADTVNRNREMVLRNLAEIRSRLVLSRTAGEDFITFDSEHSDAVNHFTLMTDLVNARETLENAGLGTDEVAAREQTLMAARITHLEDNLRDVNKKTAVHIRNEAFKAAAFSGALGIISLPFTQQILAEVGRHIQGVSTGNTLLENVLQGRPVNEWLGPTRAVGFAVDQTRELFNHPGNLPISHELTLAVAPEISYAGHAATFIDTNGQIIPMPPMHLAENGHLYVSGTVDNLPEPVRNLVASPDWTTQPTTNLNFNVREDVKDMITTGRHDTFIHGNFIIDVNSGPNGQMSMEYDPTHTRINGFFRLDNNTPVLDFDPTMPGNENITPAQWETMRRELLKDGWNINTEPVTSPEPPVPPGSAPAGTVVDQLLSQPPEALSQLGITETDYHGNDFIFHTHHDLVRALGFNTHNELTLHLGQFNGSNAPLGQITINPALTPGPIPSNLPGVPALPDRLLQQMIDTNNGTIRADNMFAVVDLTDGRQFIMPFKEEIINGEKTGKFLVNLPEQFLDREHNTYVGIKDIAEAFLVRDNGKIFTPGEILSAAQVPDNSLVHSIASEKFAFGEPPNPPPPPPPPPTPPHDVYHLTPPGATEIIPPPAKFAESPPLIPFVPERGRPLEAMKRREPLPPTPEPIISPPETTVAKTIPTPETKQEGLQESLKNANQQFEEMQDKGEVDLSGDFTIYRAVWQRIRFGEPIKLGSDDCYRGYLMIEPEDFPQALQIFAKLGKERVNQGKNLTFKWLKKIAPKGLNAQQLRSYLGNPNNLYRYRDLEPTDPRIAIYADTPEEIQEVLQAVAQDPSWQVVEQRRRDKFGGQLAGTPRRPGTNTFFANGQEFRSLNFNNRPGYSEDEAADPEWRTQKIGTPTIVLPPKPETPPSPTPPRPTIVPTPETSKPAELTLTDSSPEALRQQLNEVLASSKTNHQEVVLGVQNLVDYVQQVQLPNNAKIHNPVYQFTPEGNIKISADVSASKAFLNVNTSFSAELANDPAGGMKVVRYHVGDLGFAEFLRGQVENIVNNLTGQVQDAISKQTPGWQVAGFRLTPEHKLVFDFKRQDTPSN